jgi:hypothetical protein
MIHLPVPPEVAFDYFADPLNRPAWQSSLARVDEVSPGPAVGQTWIDVTVPGLRPRMETTVLDRPHRWTEVGTWRGISAELTLDFAPAPGGCVVEPTMRLRGPGAFALNRVAPYAVRSDLKRAARLLGGA